VRPTPAETPWRARRRAWRPLMPNSKAIAGLMGPTLIALAVSLLVNLNAMVALVEPVSRDPSVVFISALISFVCCLATVRLHNHWVRDWTVLITIFGWLLLVGGLVRMLFPIWLAALAAKVVTDTGFIAGEALVLLLIGAYLSYKAYTSG